MAERFQFRTAAVLLAVRRRWKGIAKVDKVFGVYKVDENCVRMYVPLSSKPVPFSHEKCHRTLLDPESPGVAAFVPG